MSGAETASDELREVYEDIAQIVRVLEAAQEGDDDIPRARGDLPEAHPLRALHLRVNDVLASLSAARARGARVQEELEDQLLTIELQRAALRELSTPIIEVWRGVLCLPIIGIMDSERGAQMMGEILTAVVDKRASQVIIDLTGIDTMDSETLNQLVATAKAIRLLGTECVLTGIRPAVAQTLVALQFGGSVETTLRSVREALNRILSRRPAP